MTTRDATAQPRRRRRKEARPGELVAAGLAEFAEKGFAATRLEDVAARAGVVKGTIYRYFDGKEALFREAVRLHLVPVFDGMEAAIDGYDGPSEALLRRLIDTVYARLVASEARVLIRIIIAESVRFPEIPAHYHREVVSRGEALLSRILRRGIARGEFRESAVLDVPVVVMAPALMAAIWQMTFAPVAGISPERFRKAHLDLVLDGLRVRGTGDAPAPAAP